MSTAKKATPAGAALSPYDTAEFLRTPAEIAAYLEVVFEDYGDDPHMIVKALGDVARAQGMKKVAKATGLNREGLYQALSGKGNPSFGTILKVMGAVGVELRPRSARRRKEKTQPFKEILSELSKMKRSSANSNVGRSRRSAHDKNEDGSGGGS